MSAATPAEVEITYDQTSGRYRYVIQRPGLKPYIGWADTPTEAQETAADFAYKGPARVVKRTLRGGVE